MPFPKKYTSAEISKLYDEYRDQEKDMKTFCAEKGLNYKTIFGRFDRLERRLAKGLPPIQYRTSSTSGKDVAEEEVATTVQQEIAAESKSQTQQYIILGKKIWESFAAFASKKGLNLSKLKDVPIHEVVLDAMTKAEEYDRLADRYKETVEALNFYQSRTDPLIRLERGIDMLTQLLQFALLMDGLGIDVLESDVGQFYASTIERYLMGKATSVEP